MPSGFCRRYRAFASVVAVPMWLTACSFIVDPDVESLGREPPACERLECNACICQPGNRASYQLCNEDGEYEPCMCQPPPPAVPPACMRLDAGS